MSQPDTTSTKPQRPLSPHLQIYRWQLTMVMSILHRATGVALLAGVVPFTWWLVAAATGPAAYEQFMAFCASPLGLLMLLGWMVAFYYHLANGVRHLIWDSGHLFKIKNAYAAGYFVLAVTALLSAMTWCYLY